MEKNKTKIVERISLPCACDGACGELRLEAWGDGTFTGLSYVIPAWYAYDYVSLKKTLKIIWNLLLGREYYLYEVEIRNNDKLKEFKDFVANMREIKNDNSSS